MIFNEDAALLGQIGAIDRLYNFDVSLLIAGTGCGKTLIALTAAQALIADGHLRRVIVAAPARVVSNLVWPNEAAKWEHLRSLTVLQLEGTSQQRIKQLLSCPSDIIVVSLNNLNWLLDQDHECDGIIIDELSKASGKWTQGLKSKKKAGRLVWRVGMTATPVSQDWTKVYAMARVLDNGAALGRNKNTYLETYFFSDYQGYNWTLREGADALIMSKLDGLVYAMADDKAAKLPALHQRERRFTMPVESREHYNEMKKHMVIDDLEAEAANEAVKSSKLRQVASGFIYVGEETTSLDSARVNEAVEWCRQLGHRKGIIFYEYVEQLEQLKSRLLNTTQDVTAFKQGDYRVLLAQINSLSHGVDGLQKVCSDMLMYHPFWSRDATEQSTGRLHRTGQKNEVTVTTLVCDDTLDDLVLARVEDRGVWMRLFLKHLKGE